MVETEADERECGMWAELMVTNSFVAHERFDDGVPAADDPIAR